MRSLRMQRWVLFGTSALLLSSCEPVQSPLYPAGPAAERLAHMSWLMIILFLVVTAAMWILIAVAASKRRGTLDEHAPVDTGGGQNWIAIGGLAVPFAILFVLFVLGLRLMASFPMDSSHDHGMQPQIRITGHQWWWEVDYLEGSVDHHFTTANEIHIPVGQPVEIELRSQDVIHSFWVPALHGKVDLIPGRVNSIRIQADHPGTLHGQCAEYCGAEHAHMGLLVIAQESDAYQAWLEQQLQPASEPADAVAQRGEQVFLAGPCSMCHQVRGTLAGGRVAPDLTHIGSRRYIAANSYLNNDANLMAWATHAQSLKPEAAMPNLTQFSGQQLQDLVAYLRQLK